MWLMLLKLLLLAVYSRGQLHINDVCDGTQSPPRCYVWDGNMPPFNSVMGILGNLVCQDGCSLLFNPYSGQTCTSLPSCANTSLVIGAVATFPMTAITVLAANTTIASLSHVEPVQLVLLSEQPDCTFFTVVALHATFRLVRMLYTSSMCSDIVVYPIIFRSGGDVVLANIHLVSNANFQPLSGLIFVHITTLLNLTIATVTFQPDTALFAVILLDGVGLVQNVDATTRIFKAANMSSSQLITLDTMLYLPALKTFPLTCPVQPVIENTACNDGDRMTILLVLFFALLVFVFTLLCIYGCRLIHHSTKNFNRHFVVATELNAISV